MKEEEKFWFLTMARGLIAIVVGSGILVVPDLARTMLLLPIAVTLSLLLFAVYGLLDGAVVLVSSFTTTLPTMRWITRIQGIASVVMAGLLATVLFDHVRLSWFLSLATIQAFFTAIAEFVVGRHSATQQIRLWDFGAAAIAAIFAAVYLYARIFLADRLTYQEVSLLVYGFILTFGIAQCVNAMRMLYGLRAHSMSVSSAA